MKGSIHKIEKTGKIAPLNSETFTALGLETLTTQPALDGDVLISTPELYLPGFVY